jgi:hypothetical protein
MRKDPIAQAREALREAMASDPAGPSAEALRQVAAALDGVERAEGRLAAQLALLDDRLLGIENNRIFAAWRSIASKLTSRRRGPAAPAPAEYNVWVAHEQAAIPSIGEARAISGRWRRQPIFAIRPLVPGDDFLSSLENQSYPHHSLCTDTLTGADSDYLCIIGAGGTLSPLALHYLAEALQTDDPSLVYCDEDLIAAAGARTCPTFRPDWSPDLLTSCLYTGSVLAISRSAFMNAGGLGSDLAPAQMHDLALRVTDSGRNILHVPRVLFHRRAAPAETPGQTRAVIKDAIYRREHTSPELTPGPVPGSFLVMRQGQNPETTAVICSKSPRLLATCLDSLKSTAGGIIRKIVVIAHEEHGPNHDLRQLVQRYGGEAVPYTGVFNFALMNNLGSSHATTPHLLFLNDDVRATSAGWAELLVSHLFAERIGIAGAVLRYPSGGIQHAGIVTGINDGVGHAGRHITGSELWPWLLTTRNVSAVTGACLAIRAATFHTLGGFDPEFPNNYNDVDLCFRAREAGLDIVCVPVPGLIHAECQTRPGLVRFQERYRLFRKWGHILSCPDPYYSPALAPTEQIRLDPGGTGGFRPLLA